MSAVSILILCAIISAFVVFMVSLAWAERQTRHLSAKPVEARASIRAARPVRG